MQVNHMQMNRMRVNHVMQVNHMQVNHMQVNHMQVIVNHRCAWYPLDEALPEWFHGVKEHVVLLNFFPRSLLRCMCHLHAIHLQLCISVTCM